MMVAAVVPGAVPVTLTPSLVLPEMRLRSAAVSPPMVFFEVVSMVMRMPLSLAIALLPAASVPM